MCGILAYYGEKSEDRLNSAFKTISHRGPDETKPPEIVGSIDDKNVIFGFHRLRINGLSALSGQPMRLGTSVLICNGEIYNYQKLADENGFKLETGSDCEIILHMYQKYGIFKTVQQLEGVFALSLYDYSLQQLFVARDPIGVRPCYIANEGPEQNEWAFASEEKALLTFDRDTIRAVEGGTILTLPSGEIKRYINFEEIVPCSRPEDPYAELARLITHAVTVRTAMTERPVGVFLSGGVDSSIVAMLAKQVDPRIKSYSISLEGSNSTDLVHARAVAEALELDHTEVFFTVEEALSTLRDLIFCLGTCDVTTIRASMPMYLLSKYLKRHTDRTIMLSGEGPDEFCSGYLYNHNAPTPEDLHREAVWRTVELPKFDVKRADHSTAAWSLEVRVPYLCKHVVSYVLGLDPKLRDPKYNNGIEKYLLRKAFQGSVLPDHILWRPKEAFSDGVGYNWVNSIQKHAELTVDPEQWMQRQKIYPQMTPLTKEAFMYRTIYEEFYHRTADPLVPYFWLPKWSDHGGDPSARVLNIHKTLISNKNN